MAGREAPPARRRIAILIVLALSLAAAARLLLPLATDPGLAPGADTPLHVGNVVEAAYLLESRWPPWDWLPDVAGGHGGPNYVYYGSGAFVLPAFLVKLGLSPVAALKALVAAGFIAASFAAFLWCSRFGGLLGGLAGACLFVHSPYFFSMPYVRGSYPEFLAAALYPLLFWCSWRWCRERKTWMLLAAAATFAAIVSIHTLSLILVAPFIPLVALGAALEAGKGGVLRALLSSSLLLALGAVLAAPAIASPLLERGKVEISAQFATAELYCAGGVPWYSFLNAQPIHPYPTSYWVPGRAHLLAFGGAVLLLLAGWRGPGWRLAALHAALAGVTLLLAERSMAQLSVSLAPPLRYLQFPTRFLGVFNVFCAAALAAAFFAAGARAPRWRSSLAAAVPLLLVFLSLGMLPRQQWEHFRTATREGIRQSLTTLDHEDKYLPQGATLPRSPAPQVLLKLPGPGEVIPLAGSLNDHTYAVHLESPSRVVFHQYFFDGWNAEVDGKPAPLGREESLGLITLDLPEGPHTVRLFFTDTPLRAAAKRVGLAGWAAVLGLAAVLAVRGCVRASRRRVERLPDGAASGIAPSPWASP
jgi:hypothetical protein